MVTVSGGTNSFTHVKIFPPSEILRFSVLRGQSTLFDLICRYSFSMQIIVATFCAFSYFCQKPTVQKHQ